MADNIIEIEVEIDGKKGFAKLNRDAFKAGQDAGEETAEGFSKGFAKLKALVAGLAIGAVLVKTLKESIQAASEQEDAINRLNQALARTGQYSPQFSQAMQDLASNIQATTKFADEAILSGVALLQTIGKLNQAQLPDATKAAVDLAAAYKIDLESAFRLVGKAAEGQVAQLGRLGIEVRKGATDAETFANALVKIKQATGGAAAKDINTFSGAVANMKNQFGEVLESIGNVIIKSPALVGMLKGFGTAFNNISVAISKASFAKFFNDFVLGAASVGSAVIDYIIKPFEMLMGLGNFVFGVIRSGLQGVVVTVSAVGLAITALLEKIGVVSEETTNSANMMYQTALEQQAVFNEQYKTAFAELGSTPFGDAIASQWNVIANAARNAGTVVVEAKNQTVQATNDMEAKIAAASAKISQILQQGVMKAVSGSIQMIGASLVKGGNAFADFGKMVLGILGDMAIQIGETLIGIGLGIEKLKIALGTMSGAVAIAAGFALIALGGALKAMSGGGLGGIAGGGGGGVTPVVAEPAEIVGQEDIEERKPKTEVVINVEGNVYNGREQAQIMAETLQEYFDTNAGILVRS
jgi:hypothetical protein